MDGSGNRGSVIRSVAGGCFVLVCACVAGVNKIRLKVTDGSAGSRGLESVTARAVTQGVLRPVTAGKGLDDTGAGVMPGVIKVSEYTKD